MGLETTTKWRCDVCRATANQGEAEGWWRASIEPLEQPTPVPFVDGMQPPQPPVPLLPSVLCPKAACATAFIKERTKVAKP